MGTEKTKVKGLDVFLQVMIAIFSLAWIGLYIPFLIEEEFGIDYYGSEALTSLLASVIFSVMVFVFVTFLFRKITATVVRVLFTFSFVLLMIQFYGFLGELWNVMFSEYYRYYGITIAPIWLINLMPMILILLMLCFSMARQKHSGMFIGQVICLILLVISDALAGIYVFDEYEMDVVALCYFIAMWCFHFMLALLSIWLRRRNYYRAQEECAAAVCPFMSGAYVPGMAVAPIATAPAAMTVPAAPVVPVAAVEPKPVDGIPCPVCGEICEKDALFCGTCGTTLKRKTEETPTIQPKVKEYDSTPTLEPEWEEEPATQMDAYEEEPVTKIAGFEDVAITAEPVVEEKTEPTRLPESEWEEEPVTAMLLEPEKEEAPVIQEPMQEEPPVVPEVKAKFCRKCGALLEEGTFFCCECGTRIEE